MPAMKHRVAGKPWAHEISTSLHFRASGFHRSNPAVFHSHRGDGRMLVHGDDFVLLADDGEIKAVEQ